MLNTKKTCKFEALQRRTQQDTVPPKEKGTMLLQLVRIGFPECQ